MPLDLRRVGLALAGLAALAAATASWPAPAAAAPPVAGEDLRVSVVTFGPHAHPFFKFGHNALLIEHRSGQGYVYNFGMFNFGSAALIPKFILGRSMYWLGRGHRDAVLPDYIEENRTVEVQELDLTPEQRQRIFERLEETARPQNRYYLYDYFFDNCSTRVRDAVDEVLGGQLRRAATAPARLTYRGHALRLTADLAWEYVALAFALGNTADRSVTRFEEGFIPMELRDLLREVKLPAQGELAARPLVKSERVIYRSTNPDPPRDPPNRVALFALIGVLCGGLLAGLGRLGAGRAWARVTFAALAGTLASVLGLLGTLLVFLWVATNHRAAHANANILQALPLALAFAVLAPGVARRRPQALRRAWLLACAALAASALGYLLRVVGLVGQDNRLFVALLLPLWAGLSVGLRALQAAPAARSGDA